MRILFPTTITASMIKSGTTIAEPDTGETLWVSAGSYTVGQERIYEHKTYACVQTHSGRTASPDTDSAYWLWNERKPSNRWAPFDYYTDTPATGTTTFTYVLEPGFFNGISMYGLVGDSVDVTVKDVSGGTTTYTHSSDLYDQALGLYELLFSALRQRQKLVLSDIPISPTAELTITITAASGNPVALGMLQVGDWRTVVGAAEWGGVQYGASGEPRTYSYIKFNDDGTSTIRRRGKSTDVRGVVGMPSASADYAVQLVQQVLDVPVSIVCTQTPGYDYLNVFGLISGNMKATSFSTADFDFQVKGFL